MDVNEFKQKKQELENELKPKKQELEARLSEFILGEVCKFTEETGVCVDGIHVRLRPFKQGGIFKFMIDENVVDVSLDL